MRSLAACGAGLLLLAGCASGPSPAPAGPEQAAAAPQEAWSDAIRWVTASAEFRAALHQAFQLATERVEELSAGREPGTWAVVIDADETIISNVRYEMEHPEFGEETWAEWVDRRSAPGLPGAAEFLHVVRGLGGRIAVVSNRLESTAAATEETLRRAGLPFDVVLLKPDGGSSDKTPRFRAVEEGTAAPGLPPLEVVLWVGDNIRDFPGLDQAVVRRDPAALEPFGDRYIVLPNPLYGSWEREPVPAEPFAAPAAAAGGGGALW